MGIEGFFVFLLLYLAYKYRKQIRECFLALQKEQSYITEKTLPGQESTVSVVSVASVVDCYITHYWPEEDPKDPKKLTNELAWKFFEEAYRHFKSHKGRDEKLSKKECVEVQKCYDNVSDEAPDWITKYASLWSEWEDAGLLD